LENAPSFEEVAPMIYDMLNGRIWAGHNIISFDNNCIKESFDRIGVPPPVPFSIIDTLVLIRKYFKDQVLPADNGEPTKQFKNFKLATLGDYFGLGQEEHRAMSDVRMNIEVMKRCSFMMFLNRHIAPEAALFSLPNPAKTPTNTPKKQSHPKKTPIALETLDKQVEKLASQIAETSISPVSENDPTTAENPSLKTKEASFSTTEQSVTNLNANTSSDVPPTENNVPLIQDENTKDTTDSKDSKDAKDAKDTNDSTINTDAIQKIQDSISQARKIWINYKGGPPRAITGIQWTTSNSKFQAMCHIDNMVKSFFVERISGFPPVHEQN